MKKFVILIGVSAFALVALGLSIFEGESQTKVEEQKDKIKLELILQKEFPEGIVDVAFDKERGGLFCPSVIVTGRTHLAIEAIHFMNENGEVRFTRERQTKRTKAKISSNGKYVGILDPIHLDVEKDPVGPVEIIDLTGRIVTKTQEITGPLFRVSPSGDRILVHNGYTGVLSFVDQDKVISVGRVEGTVSIDSKNLRTATPLLGELIRVYPWGGEKKRHFLAVDTRTNRKVPSITSEDQRWIGFLLPDTLLLYDYEKSLMKNVTNVTEHAISTLSFSPQSNFLVVGKSIGGQKDKRIHLFLALIRLSPLELLWKHELSFSKDPGDFPSYFKKRLAHIGVSNEGKYVIASQTTENIYIYDRDGTLLKKFVLPDDSLIKSVKLNPEGNTLTVVTAGNYYSGKQPSTSGFIFIYRIVEEK